MWRIFDMLFPPRVDDVALRDVSSDAFLALLEPRLIPATSPATVALLPYPQPIVRSAIHEAKYHGSERAISLLSSVLSEYMRDSDDSMRRPIVVPVPLGKARRKERGFNQIEEVLRRTAEECDFENGSDLLIRVRDTASQVSLPRQKREENMRGAFRPTRPADASRSYFLIDDVLTTGATLQACIDALREAGATHIVPIALAH